MVEGGRATAGQGAGGTAAATSGRGWTMRAWTSLARAAEILWVFRVQEACLMRNTGTSFRSPN